MATLPSLYLPIPSHNTLVFMRGFGGVKISGGAAWPARVCDDAVADEKVLKARKPGRVLVRAFGDEAFVGLENPASAPLRWRALCAMLRQVGSAAECLSAAGPSPWLALFIMAVAAQVLRSAPRWWPQPRPRRPNSTP